MTQDWDAVAAAINTRMDELHLTQQEVARRAQVSVALLRQLQRNYAPRKRNPALLEAISKGLEWPPGHLAQVATGQTAVASDDPIDALRVEVAGLRDEVATLRGQVAQLSQSVYERTAQD
ncbi:XRE family transcriptional regulator [Kutzneria sp. NPDC051319]|uniref:helix-turn-helix domain-containing protein n=1 Tax=Kutzneria sp. NPDC051319 TaxID=3155047 RepID=UPI0034376CAE